MKHWIAGILLALLPGTASASVLAMNVTDSMGSGTVTAEVTPGARKTLPGAFCTGRKLLARRVLSDERQAWSVRDEAYEGTLDLLDLAATDLDGNGLAETWIVYRVGNWEEGAPFTLKIIMREGNRKYAARGNPWEGTTGDIAAGECRFDDAMSRAPEVFRKRAARLWLQHREMAATHSGKVSGQSSAPEQNGGGMRPQPRGGTGRMP